MKRSNLHIFYLYRKFLLSVDSRTWVVYIRWLLWKIRQSHQSRYPQIVCELTYHDMTYIASKYATLWTGIIAGTVFGSDGYRIGSIFSTGGVVLRYATDFCFELVSTANPRSFSSFTLSTI